MKKGDYAIIVKWYHGWNTSRNDRYGAKYAISRGEVVRITRKVRWKPKGHARGEVCYDVVTMGGERRPRINEDYLMPADMKPMEIT
jgi:hypothetical protein